VEEILEEGAFCYVGTSTPRGPHVTPMVYTASSDRVWVTTSRGSVKARAWRNDPRVAGLVRTEGGSVVFTAEVHTYDLLQVSGWFHGVRDAPAVALAATRFTRKNARFFAGYAVDAHKVPLAWTPPGRVFASFELDRSAVLEADGALETSGAWLGSVPSSDRFRARRTGPAPLEALPEEVRSAIGDHGRGALVVEGFDGVVVLPASWVMDGASLYAALPSRALALADARGTSVPVALAIDRASWWRAREMTGAMVCGEGELFAIDALGSGRRSAEAIAETAGERNDGVALVRVSPRRLVWWQGWEAGTVTLG
jgi:hypothetical protein